MKHPFRLALYAIALVAAVTAADTAPSAAAEQAAPAAANEWTFECGSDPTDGHRFCVLSYLHTDPAVPGDYLTFGVIRQNSVEAVFLQTRNGLSGGSRVWIQVDGLPTREFAAPKPGRMLQPPQAADPLAGELAKGSYVVIAFQPANGQRRNVRIPLEGFDLLFEQLRQEVP